MLCKVRFTGITLPNPMVMTLDEHKSIKRWVRDPTMPLGVVHFQQSLLCIHAMKTLLLLH